MAGLQLEVRVPHSPELMAQPILQGIRKAEAGDAAGARSAYSAARAVPLSRPESWIALAALAIAVEDPAGATAHATRALQSRRDDADAWVNLGVAHWHAGRRREGAQAMHQAAMLAPGMEAAALNYSMMLRAVDQLPRAREVLERAVLANPDGWRLHLGLAEACRLLEAHDGARRHVLAALQAMPLPDGPAPAPSAPGDDTGERVGQALFATADALDAAGIPFHLIGGTLLALHRDGRPFPNDKDIDLGLWSTVDRDAVDAALAIGFRRVMRVDDPRAIAAREWVMGYVHEASGIGVDLMFARDDGQHIHFGMGWPDHLASRLPTYPLQAMEWGGRQWQVPGPPSLYLDAIYGPEWRQRQPYFDTQVSNPSRTPESLPRAVTLALLRVADAVQRRQWAKADALAAQVLAREDLVELHGVRQRIAARLPA